MTNELNANSQDVKYTYMQISIVYCVRRCQLYILPYRFQKMPISHTGKNIYVE